LAEGETTMTKYGRTVAQELADRHTNGSLERWAEMAGYGCLYQNDEYIYAFKNEDEACDFVMKEGISLDPVRPRPPLIRTKSPAINQLLNVSHLLNQIPDANRLTPESCRQRKEKQSTIHAVSEGDGNRQ
jgi:hypothetical protein